MDIAETESLLADGPAKRPGQEYAEDDVAWADTSLPQVPEERNSALSTSAQITNTMIGSGILTFPYVLAAVGIGWYATLMVTFGVAVHLSTSYLLLSGQKLGFLNYSEVVQDVFGTTMRRVLNVSIALSSMGALMSYMNTIGTLGSDVMGHWWSSSWLSSYSGFMIVVVTLVELPLILIRSYGELALISYGSLMFICATILFIAFDGPNETDGEWLVAKFGPESGWDVVKELGSFSYAYSMQYVIFEAYASMTPEAKPQWQTTVARSVVMGGVLLTLMAMFGYAAFGQDCNSDILTNFDASEPLVQVAMLVVVLHLLCYIPNDFVIMRLFFLNTCDLNVLRVPTPAYVLTTLGLFGAPLLLMASIPEEDVLGYFSLIIDLTGDVPTGFCAFLLPSLLYLSVYREERGWYWWLAWPVAALGATLIFVCPVVDIATFYEACHSDSGCSSY